MRQTKLTVGLAVAAMLVATSPALSQAIPKRPPDEANGRQLAERLCTNCHNVGPGSPASSAQVAPPFEWIARKPGQSLERIAGAIIVPHPEMPSVALTMQEIRDVVAYIASLKN